MERYFKILIRTVKKDLLFKQLLFLIVFLLTGCEDFLEKKPQGELTQEEFPVSASDALQATNAAYSSLRNWYYHSGGYPILDIMSDDAVKGSNINDQLSTIGPYEDFTFNSAQDGLDRWWAALYEGIRRTNVVIEKVPGIPMNESLKSRYVAEARFLRGLFYFDLVRAWGGVPIVKTISAPLKVERSSSDEIYKLIEDDLNFSAATLPEQSEYSLNEKGRASKGAAKSLLAKMYLFRQDFVNAEKFALEVINSGQYSLEAEFVNANSQQGEQGVESVFEIGAMRNESSAGGGNQYANVQGVRGSPNRGWGFNRPSIDLQNAFDPADPRKDATIIFLGEVLDGITILGDGQTADVVYSDPGKTTIKEIECYNQKVWIPGDNTITQFGHNRRILRYADVLLMAAEALNENNKPDQALTFLNQVRKRARGTNEAILPDITQTEKGRLSDLILQERRFELALEGHRFWDLVRTGKALEVLGKFGFQQGKHELLPIPQTEIDISEGTLKQNPGWD